MTIKSKAFAMTKQIIKSEERDEILEIVNELNDTSDLIHHDKLDKGKMIKSQSARHHNSQFYSYLLVEGLRKEMEEELNIEKIPEMNQKQKELLLKGHKDFIHMNYAIASLLPASLKHADVLDPYSYNRSLDENIEINQKYGYEFLGRDEVQRIVNEFKNHESLKFIKKIPSEVLHKLSTLKKEEIKMFIKRFYDEIIEAGVQTEPEGLKKIIKQAKQKDRIIPLKYMFALLCLSCSIQNLNQLIYQSFFTDKLPVCHENNIINLNSSTYSVGKGYHALVQEIEPTDAGKLILLDDPYKEEEKIQLGIVEKITTKHDQKTGQSISLEIRHLNHDLNPFSNIIESF